MAIFGGMPKKATFGQIPGMGMMQPELPQPMMQPGMMQAPVPMEAKKPGPNWAGIAADFLAGMAGQPGQFAAQQQHERAMQQRIQMAEQGRQQGREDFIWKSQYERDNPKPTSPYRWESNDGSLMEIGPDGQPRQVYKDPTKRPEYRQGPDGRFYPIDTATGPLPTFTADDWNKGQPLGGSVGNGTGGFR